jgi:hypothetical protein
MIHQIRARSQELCETDLQLLTEEEAAKHNTTTANTLKAILKHEQGASIFPLLRSWIKGPQNGSLDELWTPHNPLNLRNTSWTAIAKKQAIFEALLQKGREHFSQATKTPFVSGPISEYIGPFEFNKCSRQILRGNLTLTLSLFLMTSTFIELLPPWLTQIQQIQ